MIRSEGFVVVAGATGSQGGAVARHLLRGGFRVRGISRNPTSTAAVALAKLGAEMVAANLENPADLDAALCGAHGVFSVQNYYEKGVGYEGEIRQGTNLVLAAKRQGVKHFVQSTMAKGVGAERVEHFQSKVVIEHVAREHLASPSFIGTVWFMDNLFDKSKGGELSFAVIAGTMGLDRPFESLAVDDIGKAALRMFDEPHRYAGKHVALAGDRLTIREMRQIYTEVMGRKTPVFPMPNIFARLANRDFAAQLRWQRDIGWKFSLTESNELVPDLCSFRAFLHGKTGALR
jgi:uncharacterized protein YbjT (DUF2867 family)